MQDKAYLERKRMDIVSPVIELVKYTANMNWIETLLVLSRVFIFGITIITLVLIYKFMESEIEIRKQKRLKK